MSRDMAHLVLTRDADKADVGLINSVRTLCGFELRGMSWDDSSPLCQICIRKAEWTRNPQRGFGTGYPPRVIDKYSTIKKKAA